jgi:hypothetical protein
MPKVASDEEMAYEAWLAKYQPIDNPHPGACGGYDGKLFETFGVELTQVEMNAKMDVHHVWTLGEHDGITVLSPGFWIVNRMGYFICQEPWVEDPEGPPNDIVMESGVEL